MKTLKVAVVVLALALVGLGGTTYYLLVKKFPVEAEARCKNYIETQVVPQAQTQCQEIVTQVKDGLDQCMAEAQKAQEVLTSLAKIPACAKNIPTK